MNTLHFNKRYQMGSIDPQEDVRQKVRSILSQVANKKLTAQEANKIIAKIKQGG